MAETQQNTAQGGSAPTFAARIKEKGAGKGAVLRAARLRPWREWEGEGVTVQNIGVQTREDIEDQLLAPQAEGVLYVTTGRRSWMKYLEALGARPENITIGNNTTLEARDYTVPKAWLTALPFKRPKARADLGHGL